MPEILQSKIPYNVSEHKKLPGMLPLAEDGWLIEDEAYAAQLAERDRLLQDTPDKVFADAGASVEAKREVLDEILAQLRRRTSYRVETTMVQRPDGVQIGRASCRERV